MIFEPPNPLPADVVRFLTQHITSVSELDVLRLLHRSSTRLSASEVGRELRFGHYFAELLLDRLCSSGLIAATADGYELATHGQELATLKSLMTLADRYRVRIASVILNSESLEGAPQEP